MVFWRFLMVLCMVGLSLLAVVGFAGSAASQGEITPTPTPIPTPESSLPTLIDLFSDDNCTGACWQGIEPGVTSRAEAEEILRRAEIDFVISWDDVDNDEAIYDAFVSPLLVPAESDELRLARINFDPQGIVSRILLLDDICITHIVESYGPPAFVARIGSTASFYLPYPDIGLMFCACWIEPDPHWINWIELMSTTNYFYPPSDYDVAPDHPYWNDVQEWDAVAEDYLGDCE